MLKLANNYQTLQQELIYKFLNGIYYLKNSVCRLWIAVFFLPSTENSL